jgi:sec-independent protein translocase protein TatB
VFQVGPFELVVLAIVGLLVLGPERLPGYAKQAAQVLRTLRELATGAQKQLRDELGPEFADVDLRNLNPRHVVRRAIFDDDFDFDELDPRKRLRNTFVDDDMRAASPRELLRDDAGTPARANGSANGRREHVEGAPVSMRRPVSAPTPSAGLGVPQASGGGSVNGTANGTARPRPRPSPHPRPSYEDDIT